MGIHWNYGTKDFWEYEIKPVEARQSPLDDKWWPYFLNQWEFLKEKQYD
jgi:hypothetical protein